MGSTVRNMNEYLELVDVMDQEDYALAMQLEWEQEVANDRKYAEMDTLTIEDHDMMDFYGRAR